MFHFEKDDLNHEFQVNRIHSFENLNLRLVWLLSKYLKMIVAYETHINMELLLLWHSMITFKALSRVSNGPGDPRTWGLGWDPKLECFVFSDEIMTDSLTEGTGHSNFYHLQIQSSNWICTNFSSFLDEIICLISDLELLNPDLTDIPSFKDKIILLYFILYIKFEIMVVF